MFIGLSIVLVLGGCTLLVGGCSMALQEQYENMDEDTQKELRQKMDERGHSKETVDTILGTSE